MDNKNRGEKTVDFKGEKITLRLPINSICKLEDAVDMPIGEFVEQRLECAAPRMGDLRRMAWSMMVDDRPDSTVEDAGALMQALGTDFAEVMREMFAANFPDPDPAGGPPEKK